MCSLKELQDGTYSIEDLADMHEALDLKEAIMDIMPSEEPMPEPDLDDPEDIEL